MSRPDGAPGAFALSVGRERAARMHPGGVEVGARLSASKVRTSVALAAVVAMTMTLAACGSSSKSSANNVISAGQIDIQLPPGWTVTKDGKGAIRPASDSSAAGTGASGPSAAVTGDSIPLAGEDPTTKFFTAINVFQSCLKGLGVKFIGAPDQSNPSSPTNDPGYLKNLSTCAAKSNILQALKDQQSAQDSLTPAQIKQQNKGYLAFRQCMIGRGWGMPVPTPDSKGRLFSFGAGGGSSTPNFTPPPGQDLLSSPDLQDCASEAQKKVPTGG
jgi:hypothetical protein